VYEIALLASTLIAGRVVKPEEVPAILRQLYAPPDKAKKPPAGGTTKKTGSGPKGDEDPNIMNPKDVGELEDFFRQCVDETPDRRPEPKSFFNVRPLSTSIRATFPPPWDLCGLVITW
jgi:hypothetical protein